MSAFCNCPRRLLGLVILLLSASPIRPAKSAVLFSEGFDSSAANVKVNRSTVSAVDYVSYANLTVGATNFAISEAPSKVAGSAATQGVLMRVNHTGMPGGTGSPAAINMLAGATPVAYSGNYAVSYDVYMNTSNPNEIGSTQQALFGLGTNNDVTLEASFNRSVAGITGTWGWLTNENGAAEDAAINQNGTELADIGDTDSQDVQAGISPNLFNQAFPRTTVPTINASAARQWVHVELRNVQGQVSVLFNGVKFFGNSKDPNISSTATSGFAMLGFEDRFASIAVQPDLAWALFDNFVVREVSATTPGIFKWEYINPNNPALGKQQSTVLTIGGAGLYPEPYLYAGGKNLANAYLKAADLTNSAFNSANLTRAVLDDANLTNANFTGANLTGASLSQAVMTDAIVRMAKLSSTHITLSQLYSTASYKNHDLKGVYMYGNDLSGANLAGQELSASDFYAAKLVGANFTNSTLMMAELINADLTGANLTGANFVDGSLALANLSNANLTNANLSGTNLIGTTFIGANIRGASLGRIITSVSSAPSSCKMCCGYSYNPGTQTYVSGSGITLGQLASTANYAARDLSEITFKNNDFAGGNFADFNLANTDFTGTPLTNANLARADARGAIGLDSISASNFIRPDGHVSVNLTAGETLSIRDYDGKPGVAPIPIQVDQQYSQAPGAALRMIFEADAWDSTISFAAGIPVTRGGTLELLFANGTNLAVQAGRTFQVFSWAGVSPTGTFAINTPHVWDLSNLYTTGQITFLSAGAGSSFGDGAASQTVPEPATLSLLGVGLTIAWARRRPKRRSNLSPVPCAARAALALCLLVMFCGRLFAQLPPIQVTKVGAPVWKPVDFQLFSAPATPFTETFGQVYTTLLPYDNPLAPTYTPHSPPYSTELTAGAQAGGYISRSVFTASAITLNPNGVYFAFMLVPDPGITGSSRDFASGPVIPNSLFPLASNIDAWLDGVLVDRLFGADALIPVQSKDAAFQGTSHLESLQVIWHPWDDDLTAPAIGNYDLRMSLRDNGGFGWDIVAPFRVVPDIDGDFNHDGSVNGADYVVWRKGLGTIYTQADYNVWRNSFGQPSGSGAGSSANSTVPEPSSLLLVTMAATGVLWRRRVAT